jgi:ABC-type antimicrobial peptide transport system permease subunit
MQFVGLILCESLVLTMMSLVLGLVLGLGAHYYFATSGFDLRWIFGAKFFAGTPVFGFMIYSHLSLGRVAWAVGIVFAMAAAFSLYPALKAARTELPSALKLF